MCGSGWFGLWPRRRHGALGSGGNEGYKAQSRQGREGFEVVSHSGDVEKLSGLGEGLVTACGSR